MARIAGVLEGAGYETFLPHRDGLEAFVVSGSQSPGLAALSSAVFGLPVSKAVFALDAYQVIEGCDALVFNMNGRVPDEGGVAEAALAFATGKPLVLYKCDARSLMGALDNSMVVGLSASFGTVAELPALVTELERVLREHPRAAQEPSPAALPPRVRETVARGRRLWRLLSSLRHAPEASRSAEAELLHLLEELS